MIKALSDLWKVFIGSIRDLQEPLQRIAVGVFLIVIAWIICYSFAALVIHFLKDLVELIVLAVGGEIPVE